MATKKKRRPPKASPVNDPGPKARPPQRLRTLQDVTFEDIAAMDIFDAHLIAASNKPRMIRGTGSLEVIRRRLKVAKETPDKVCGMCGEIGIVTGTQKFGHGIQRYMRCANHGCNYKWTWYAKVEGGA